MARTLYILYFFGYVLALNFENKLPLAIVNNIVWLLRLFI
jgi:hypothetical protein